MVESEDMQLFYRQSDAWFSLAKTFLTLFHLMQWITLEFIDSVAEKNNILGGSFSHV